MEVEANHLELPMIFLSWFSHFLVKNSDFPDEMGVPIWYYGTWAVIEHRRARKLPDSSNLDRTQAVRSKSDEIWPFPGLRQKPYF